MKVYSETTNSFFVDSIPKNFIQCLEKERPLAEQWGLWDYIPPLFENMGLVNCRNFHTNRVGWGRNRERDRISTKKRLRCKYL